MWMNVRYETGEMRVAAYDEEGNQTEEKVFRTEGQPMFDGKPYDSF